MIQNVETGRMEFFNDPIKYGIQKIVKFKDTNKLKDRKRYIIQIVCKKRAGEITLIKDKVLRKNCYWTGETFYNKRVKLQEQIIITKT